MCCFFTALVFFRSPIGILVYWLACTLRVEAALSNYQPDLVGRHLGVDFLCRGQSDVRDRFPVDRALIGFGLD